MWEDYDELVDEILQEVRWFGTITSYKIPYHEFKE